MLTAKKIFQLGIAVCLLASSFPMLDSGNQPQFKGVNLENAILQVKQLAGTAGHAGDFETRVKQALTAIKIAADLKTTIKPADGSQKTLSATAFYLASNHPLSVPFRFFSPVVEKTPNYISISLIRPTPPPRFS